MDLAEKRTLLASAERALREAGRLIRQQWQQPHKRTHKGFREWVTDTDLAVQDLLTAQLQREFPDHAFLAEEEAPQLPADGRVRWIIDPVDGTSNFSRQIPIFSTCLAAAFDGVVQVAATLDPLRDELFTAIAGVGSQCNGRTLRVSKVTDPSQAILGLDWGHAPADRSETLRLLGRLAPEVHTVRAAGSAALALAWVAAGRLDAYFSVALKPWDYAGGALLVAEAGGFCTTFAGQPLQRPDGVRSCLAGTDRLRAYWATAIQNGRDPQSNH
jgi:myo-inositol-1(or 4)-monophosphatase